MKKSFIILMAAAMVICGCKPKVENTAVETECTEQCEGQCCKKQDCKGDSTCCEKKCKGDGTCCEKKCKGDSTCCEKKCKCAGAECAATCPLGINITKIVELYDKAVKAGKVTPEIQAEYDALPMHASDCVECGSCMENCAEGINIPETMKAAAKLFGK